jgi:hypothetical protein
MVRRCQLRGFHAKYALRHQIRHTVGVGLDPTKSVSRYGEHKASISGGNSVCVDTRAQNIVLGGDLGLTSFVPKRISWLLDLLGMLRHQRMTMQQQRLVPYFLRGTEYRLIICLFEDLYLLQRPLFKALWICKLRTLETLHGASTLTLSDLQ